LLAASVDRLSLSHLAGISYDMVNRLLIGLLVILALTDDNSQPIRLPHASFRNFIIDPSRCSDARFSVDGEWQHKVLAERCLHLMAEHLCKGMCYARAPGIRVSQID
jgi:hypothetical protein